VFSPMTVDNPLENCISSSVACQYLSLLEISFSFGSLFHLASFSSGIPRLSSPLDSPPLSPGLGVPPAARCIVRGSRPPPPPPAPGLGSGVGLELLPCTWPIKEVTACVNSALWLSSLSLASQFASNSAIITLSIVSWLCSSR